MVGIKNTLRVKQPDGHFASIKPGQVPIKFLGPNLFRLDTKLDTNIVPSSTHQHIRMIALGICSYVAPPTLPAPKKSGLAEPIIVIIELSPGHVLVPFSKHFPADGFPATLVGLTSG